MTDGWDLQRRSRNRLSRVSLVEAQQHGSYHTQVLYNNIYQQCSTVKRCFAVHTPRFQISSGLWILPGIQAPDSVCVCIHILKPGFLLVIVSSPVLAQQAQIHSVWCLLLFLHLGGASETSPCWFTRTFSILTIFLSTLYLWFLCFSLKYRISHFVIEICDAFVLTCHLLSQPYYVIKYF